MLMFGEVFKQSFLSLLLMLSLLILRLLGRTALIIYCLIKKLKKQFILSGH